MSSTATYQTSSTRAGGGLLLAGIVGPSIFLAAMVLGLASGRTSGSEAGSGMALGSLGFLMQGVFLLTGACIVAFAFGQYRALRPASRIGTGLLGIAGVAVLLSGIFLTDAPGAKETTHGQIHNMLFLVTMVSMLISFCFNGVKLRRNGYRFALLQSIVSTIALPLFVGVFVTIASDPHDPLYSVGGFVEFAIIAVAFGWIITNAARIRRATSAEG